MSLDIKEKYINPYTDIGFKKPFGTEVNKDLLISFLNALFMGHQNIKDISYLPMERLGLYGNRRAIFLGYRTATVNANFLFITFERCIPIVIMGLQGFQPKICPLRRQMAFRVAQPLAFV